MTNPTTPENSANWKRRLAPFVAVMSFLVPLGAIATGGYFQQGQWPAAAAPFGFLRIAVAYLLLAAPCAWIAANELAKRSSRIWESLALIGFLAGVVIAVATTGSTAFGQNGFGETPLVRHGVRAIWSIVLQFPFALTACLLWRAAVAEGQDASTAAVDRRIRPLDFIIAILLVGVVPPTYNEFVVRRQMQNLDAAMRNLQLNRALRIVKRLNQFDCSVPETRLARLSDRPKIAAKYIQRNRLKTQEQQIMATIAETIERIQSYPDTSDDDQKVALAFDLYSLGEFAAARQVLVENGLHRSHPRGALVMGYIAEQLRQFAEAAEYYQLTIELESSSKSPRLTRIRSAFERMANCLRAAGQGPKAEKALLEGMTRFPSIKDHLTWQLAEHYRQAGRTQEAIDLFHRLATRDDSIGERARAQITMIRSSMSSCFVRLPPSPAN